MLIGFIISFPILVLGVFFRLVTEHHTKLYGPGDYEKDENFLRAMSPEERKAKLQSETNENLSNHLPSLDNANSVPSSSQQANSSDGTGKESASGTADSEENRGRTEKSRRMESSPVADGGLPETAAKEGEQEEAVDEATPSADTNGSIEAETTHDAKSDEETESSSASVKGRAAKEPDENVRHDLKSVEPESSSSAQYSLEHQRKEANARLLTTTIEARALAIRKLENELGNQIDQDVMFDPPGGPEVALDGVIREGSRLLAIKIKFVSRNANPVALAEQAIAKARQIKYGLNDIRPNADFKFLLVIVFEEFEGTPELYKERIELVADAADVETDVRLFGMNNLEAEWSV